MNRKVFITVFMLAAFVVMVDAFNVMELINSDSVVEFIKQIKKFFSYSTATDKLLKDMGYSYSSVQNDILLTNIMNTKLNLEQVSMISILAASYTSCSYPTAFIIYLYVLLHSASNKRKWKTWKR